MDFFFISKIRTSEKTKTSDEMSDFSKGGNDGKNVTCHFDISRTKSLWAFTFDMNVKGYGFFFISEIKTFEKPKRQVKR